jgi:hypothetical protein
MYPNNEKTVPGAVIAEVVFDSSWQAAGIGFRGGSEPRHVVLRALNVDIHVRLSDMDGLVTLMGQVLTRSGDDVAETANVHLLANGQRVISAKPDHLGEFRFQNIPSEGLSLQVDLPSLTLIGSLRTQAHSNPEGVVRG